MSTFLGISEARRQRIYAGGLDASARAGFLLGAFSTGLSYQPNLLSRGTRDQAVIGGVAAATAYGWGVTAHSFLRSTADRLPVASRSAAGRVLAGVVVDATAALAGLAVTAAAPPREHESPRRSLVRLAGVGLTGAGAAGALAHTLELRRGRPGARAVSLAAAVGAFGAGYALTRPGSARRGSVVPGEAAPRENVVREVAMPRAVASGLAVTAVLVAVARGESRLSGAAARAASATLGGTPTDHRALGRLVSTGTLFGLGWGLVTAATTVLTRAGTELEAAHAEPPTLAEVTGGPGSLSSWEDQTRESRRWLSTVLRPEAIERVMGEPARQPIRVYGSLGAAGTPQERAEMLLAEIDRTGALDRSVFALFSPTGSGYVNYVATETLEYLTRGDCASASIQYSVLPSALSLTKVGYATEQTRIVLNGLVQRMLARPADARPRFYLFGESLGSQVSAEVFRGQGTSGPDGVGLDAALWIGMPAATLYRQELWGERSVTDRPGVGPGAFFLPRGMGDWAALSDDDRAAVRFLLLQNGADPVPKFHAPLAWRRPDWLGPSATRPPGAPHLTRWLPAVTFVTTFVDLQNALAPTPGVFDQGGHDYRRELPEALRTVFRLEASDEQMARVQQALRTRELVWAVRRLWARANGEGAAPDGAAATDGEAVTAAIAQVAAWTGREVDREAVEEIVRTAV